MDSTFLNLIRHILAEEGGRSDHPEDRGGKTNFGVTQFFLNHVLGDQDFALSEIRGEDHEPLPEDVFSLTQGQARAIYEYYFWRLPKISQLPIYHALGVMDFAVNSGPETAIKLLQRAILTTHSYKRSEGGKEVRAPLTVIPDGRIGPKTLSVLEGCDPFLLIEEYTALRLNHIAKNPTYANFGGGWNRRITRIESKCVQLAMLNGVTHHVG